MTQHLIDQRQRAWHTMKDILDRAGAAKRSMTADEQQQFDRAEREFDDLTEQITHANEQRMVALESAVTRSTHPLGAAMWGASAPAGRSLADDPEFARFMRGEVSYLDSDVSQRTMVTFTGSAGGTTVPTTIYHQVYNWLQAQGQMLGIARRFDTPDGAPLRIPRLNAQGSAVVVGESTALSAADPTTDALTLSSYKYAQFLQVSREMLQDSAVDFGTWTVQALTEALGSAVAHATIVGTGSNQPSGPWGGQVLGTATTTQASATGVPSYSNLVDTVFSIRAPYRPGSAWLMNDAFLSAVRKIVDSQNRPVFVPAETPTAYDQILGYPILIDEHIPTGLGTAAGTPGAFGNWSRAWAVRVAGPVRIERDDSFAFSSDLASFRSVMRVDSGCLDSRAAKVIKSPTT
jgi:HK97 family phage major capsid protein